MNNLITLTTEDQVEDYIEEVLLKSSTFNLKEIFHFQINRNI